MAISTSGAALAGGGTLAGMLGNYLTMQNDLSNAQAQANAANKVLATNIGVQDQYQAQNTNTLNSDLNQYAPGAQSAQLAGAQATRAGADVGAISPSGTSGADPGGIQDPGIPLTRDAPAAVSGEIAKRMASTNAFAKSNAAALGNLGGYTDTWQTNALRDAEANRKIGATNYLSANEASLLGPEQQLAETAAYKPPTPWGALLSGIGGLAASAGGSMLGKGA